MEANQTIDLEWGMLIKEAMENRTIHGTNFRIFKS